MGQINRILWLCLLLLATKGYAQDCPNLLDPLQGATNVPVDTSISWEDVVGVTGYIISVGTTPGGGEIVNEQSVGSDTTFSPPLGLPESTQIFVRLTLFFFNQDNIVCEPQSFTTENVTVLPSCTQLTQPENGDTNVAISTNLQWSYAPKATGYRISIGTSPGGTEILNNFDVGNVLFYNPPTDFPNDTEIFVTITPYNENGMAVSCAEESFTTASLGEPPGCSQMIYPANGAINVPLSPTLEWEPVPGATGYLVYIGRSPFVNDVLDGATFTVTSTPVLNFESNNTYFILIIPFNAAGQAQGCMQESFSTILGCGPFYDPDTGELISYYPDSDLPDVIGICENDIPTRYVSPDVADGYRWFEIDANGDEELISEAQYVDFYHTGPYRYEVYDIITQDGSSIECMFTKNFMVTASATAEITNIQIENLGITFNITIQAEGIGDYEYSIDGINYQDSPTFLSLVEGYYTAYVRDKNGCGVVERNFRIQYPPTGFPPYFSPNGDGYNDYWNYVRPILNPLIIVRIYIFDRYGKVLAEIGPAMEGWDGRYNNQQMPSDGYWYKAITSDNKVYSGYFSLVR